MKKCIACDVLQFALLRDHRLMTRSTEIMASGGLRGRKTRANKGLARCWIIYEGCTFGPGLIPPSPTTGQQLVGYTPGLCVLCPAPRWGSAPDPAGAHTPDPKSATLAVTIIPVTPQ